MLKEVWASVKSVVVKVSGWVRERAAAVVCGTGTAVAAVSEVASPAASAADIPSFLDSATLTTLAADFAEGVQPIATAVILLVVGFAVFRLGLYWIRSMGHGG